jgi:hypothetical protein
VEEEAVVSPGPNSVEDLFAGEGSPNEPLPTGDLADSDVDKALEGMGDHLPKPVVIEPMVDKTLDDILSGFDT